MKNTLLFVLVIGILVLGFFFLKEKREKPIVENLWPETEPATPTNNPAPTNPNTNPIVCNSSSTPSITVLSPNGGETYYKNEAISIKWKSCNVPGNVHLSGMLVDVDDSSGDRALFCEGGSSTWDDENCLNNQGERMVTPGANTWEPGNYKLKLTSRDGVSVSDSSNGLFVILSNNAPNNATQESGDDVNGTHVGYIKSVDKSGSNYSLKIDYVILGVCPGDECLINNNPLIRTFPISSNADIKVFNDEMQPMSASLQQFDNIFSTEWAYSLNWITIENGMITKIEPQYIP